MSNYYQITLDPPISPTVIIYIAQSRISTYQELIRKDNPSVPTRQASNEAMMMMLLKIIDQAIGEFGKTDLEQTSFLIIQIVQIT